MTSKKEGHPWELQPKFALKSEKNNPAIQSSTHHKN